MPSIYGFLIFILYPINVKSTHNHMFVQVLADDFSAASAQEIEESAHRGVGRRTRLLFASVRPERGSGP
jgi:hypothetical protein